MSARPVKNFSELAVGAEFDVTYCPWCEGQHHVKIARHEEHESCSRIVPCQFAAFEVLTSSKKKHHGCRTLGMPDCQMKFQRKEKRLFHAKAVHSMRSGAFFTEAGG